ncbi:MAG: discoidin domain-containing protein [Clostridia bacterium]|nr:discoidin domain-containing protein [Clostridia bacterium]
MKKVSKLTALILSLLMIFAMTSCDDPEKVLEVMGQVLPFDVSMKNVFGKTEEEKKAEEMKEQQNSAPSFDVLPLSSDEQEMIKSVLFNAKHMLISETKVNSTAELSDTELLYFANQYFLAESAPQPDSTEGGWTDETINGVVKSIFNTEIENLSSPPEETGWSRSGNYLTADTVEKDLGVSIYITGTMQINQNDHLVNALATVEKKGAIQSILEIETEVSRDEGRSFGFYIKSLESKKSEGKPNAEIMATSQSKGFESTKLGDGNYGSMWCEEADGFGKNEAITYSWYTPQTINAVAICNSAKSGGCRVKKLEITFSDGSTEDITLKDSGDVKGDIQFFRFNREIKTEFIKFTIKSVYGSHDLSAERTYIAEITVF